MAASHGFEPYSTQNTRKSPFPNSARLDITDKDATLRLVGEIDPEVIINTAALTNVDYCETHKDEAEKVNVGGVRNVAEAARQNDSRLVQISTDYEFDGPYGHYTECDTPNARNHYANQTLKAKPVVQHLPNYAIASPS